LLGLWQVAEKADFPFSVSTGKNGAFIVHNSLIEKNKDQILNGDLFLSVNGAKPSTLEDIEFILDGMRTGSSAIVTVERGAVGLNIPVTLVHTYGELYLAVAWLVGTLFFLSGLVVLIYKRNDLAALVYHFGAVGVAAIIMMTWGCYAINPVGLGQIIRTLFSTAYIFVPVLLLHLSLVFPFRKNISFKFGKASLFAFTLTLHLHGGNFLQSNFAVFYRLVSFVHGFLQCDSLGVCSMRHSVRFLFR
jgi:hypothetical protein